MTTDTTLQKLLADTLPAESRAFHAAQGAGMLADVPRDVFQRLFDQGGLDEALRICTHPERPFAGVPLFDQPFNRMDAWERFLTAHRPAGPGA